MNLQILKTYTYPFNINLIKKDCLGKSGIYLILNTINSDSYIGSARSTSSKHNRLYFKFRNHFFNSEKSNNIYLRRSIEKYGKNNFSFNIIVFDEAKKIQELETFYIEKYKPIFNILQFSKSSESSEGYKHSEETKFKIKSNYSEERPIMIKFLNKDQNELMKLAVQTRIKSKNYKRPSLELKISESKPTSVFNSNGELLKNFNSAKEMSLYYKIDYRTIRRHIKNGKPLKNGIIIKYSL
jgi:group I intron endonuclease